MKISVIMPSYNQSCFVEAALESVLDQDYEQKEIIFIDGGSTDGTMEVVRRYEDELAYCVSEKDEGQSDALRKGFEKATGDVLTWLNTDDLLLPGALSAVAEILSGDPKIGWVAGNVVWIDVEDRILNCRKAETHSNLALRMGIFSACGPSAFFRKSLYEDVGGVNLRLHYMMDTDLWWRFIMNGYEFRRLTRYAWALRLHESAKMSGHLFADPESAAQKRIAAAKAAEHAHINQIRAGYCRPASTLARTAVQSLSRLSSPRYLRSLYDSRVWKGRDVAELAKRQ
jgi:glycosyltransferase involved in cell wall biosynthesis